MQNTELTELLSQLIEVPSVTPEDKGCQKIMAEYLIGLGFEVTHYDKAPVSNFFASIGQQGPLFVFAGHTDVVPTGPLDSWHTDPFKATVKDKVLYGRGACDMKGSLAAMLIAAKEFVHNHPDFNGRLGFLITSGEEGEHFDLGTPHVMQLLKENNIHIDYCLIGEPTSQNRLGDMIKVGRRGSITFDIHVKGKQGHVAYPDKAQNPIHHIAKAIQQLNEYQFDQGNDYFPKTSLQISNIQSGTGAGNVIPGELHFKFNIRYSTEIDHHQLISIVESILKNHCELECDVQYRLNGKPFLTEKGRLIDDTVTAIKKHTGLAPTLSTTGGTSDGRFIAPYGVEVIELGPSNETIHKVNECVSLDDLSQLKDIYLTLCEQIIN